MTAFRLDVFVAPGRQYSVVTDCDTGLEAVRCATSLSFGFVRFALMPRSKRPELFFSLSLSLVHVDDPIQSA